MLLFQVLAKNTEIDKDTEQNWTEIAIVIFCTLRTWSKKMLEKKSSFLYYANAAGVVQMVKR